MRPPPEVRFERFPDLSPEGRRSVVQIRVGDAHRRPRCTNGVPAVPGLELVPASPEPDQNSIYEGVNRSARQGILPFPLLRGRQGKIVNTIRYDDVAQREVAVRDCPRDADHDDPGRCEFPDQGLRHFLGFIRPLSQAPCDGYGEITAFDK